MSAEAVSIWREHVRLEYPCMADQQREDNQLVLRIERLRHKHPESAKVTRLIDHMSNKKMILLFFNIIK